MGSEDTTLPATLKGLTPDQIGELTALAETKAWVKASQVQPFTGPEEVALRAIEKGEPRATWEAAKRTLYNRHLWDSLRWFLFGGYVDLVGFQERPLKAYDPDTNPWIRLWVPGWAKTQDEHDETDPYKALPDKDYLRLVAYSWVMSPMVAIPKSRQMLVTWLYICIAVHTVIVRPAQRIAVVSKKADDADALIGRMETVINGLPSDRFWVPTHTKKYGMLSVPENDSHVHGMGEEAKGLRGYTFSWLFFDEVAFHDQANENIRAALATIANARMTLVSTSNGEETFWQVVTDEGRIPCPSGR